MSTGVVSSPIAVDGEDRKLNHRAGCKALATCADYTYLRASPAAGADSGRPAPRPRSCASAPTTAVLGVEAPSRLSALGGNSRQRQRIWVDGTQRSKSDCIEERGLDHATTTIARGVWFGPVATGPRSNAERSHGHGNCKPWITQCIPYITVWGDERGGPAGMQRCSNAVGGLSTGC